MIPVEAPFKPYTGLDGKPLNNGYVYFGAADQNPITSPVTVYWDVNGTIPANQPLRTVNGYVVRSGTPANVFITGSYSELIQDAKKRQVCYARNSDDFTTSGFAKPTGSALIGFKQAGTGAVTRTVQDKLRETVSVKDYGAKGDGLTDDTVAIQAAIDATQAGIILFPKGVYKVSTTLNVASSGGVTLRGENQAAVTIKTTSPTGNVINVTGWFVRIEGMYFLSSATRTGGAYVNLAGAYGSIDNFHMESDFIGIKMSGTSVRITNGVMGVGAAGGYRIWATGGDTSQIIDNVLIGSQSAPFPAAGIYVDSSAALTISNTSVISQGVCLLVAPDNGQGVYSMFVNNCFFDSALTGMQISTTGTGEVQRCRFANCWFSSMVNNGVSLVQGGTGNITGIHFSDPHMIVNGASGISINNSGVSDVTINGGEICGNSAHGVFIGAGVSNFSIVDATIGIGSGFGANGQWGIIIAPGASDKYIITNNRMYSNGAGAFSDGGTGLNKSVIGNLPVIGYAVALSGRGTTIGPGTLDVVFSAPFSVAPSVVVSAESSSAYTATPFNITVNGFSLNTFTPAGTQVAGIGINWHALKIA
jgi:hypothetical protein